MQTDKEMSKAASESRELGHGKLRGVVHQVLTSVALSMTHFCMAASTSLSGLFTVQMAAPSTTEMAAPAAEKVAPLVNFTTNASIMDEAISDNSTNYLFLTADQVSWIASVYGLGNMAGFAFSSYINPRLGALRVVQLSALIIMIGFIMMGLGNSFAVILIGRIFCGIGIGTCLGPTVTHIGEICSVRLRSVLTTFMIVNACNGLMTVYLLGWFLRWRNTCLLIGTVPMIIQLIITLFLPRSARWLISKGYPEEEAAHSLRFYMGSEHDVMKEIAEIKQSLGASHKHDASLLQVLATFHHRHHLVPLLIVMSLHGFFVFSGGLGATSFAPVIFKEVGGFDNPYIGSILLAAIRMITTMFTAIIMDRVRRKTLMIINGLVGAAACLVTSVYFFFIKEAFEGFAWVPLVSVLVIVCFMSVGVSPLMNVMFSELLPNAIRAEAGGVNLVFFAIFNFTMVYTFPMAVRAMHMGGLFAMYAGMHILMALFGRFVLPETQGKSIEQIQRLFVRATVQDAVNPLELGGTPMDVEMTSSSTGGKQHAV